MRAGRGATRGKAKPPAKIVPRSKISEWKGLDRIATVVHSMPCIWREQEKDDIGIDGEIELCVAREDGEGFTGTGRIVKVQSKSGSTFVVRDTEDTFASPVTLKDLAYWRGMNVPVVYIVYHPDDDVLYWKDVKAYLADHPEALLAPHRIEFDKKLDRFDDDARETLHAVCRSAPERVSTDVGETLYTNLLEVVAMPRRIWSSSVLPQKQTHFHDRLVGEIQPYVFRSGMVACLGDPREGGALAAVIDPASVEQVELGEWLRRGSDADNDLRRLMNGLFHRHLRSLGLSHQRHPRRYFFNKRLGPVTPLRRTWISCRTGRSNTRFVAKLHDYGSGRPKFYRHVALDFRFETYGATGAFALHPNIHYTEDGVRPWEGEVAKSYAIRARADEYNDVYLNNLLFWSHVLSDGSVAFDLNVGAEVVATVAGAPTTVVAPFSVQTGGGKQRRGGGRR